MAKRDYDSTVARIAGNLLSGDRCKGYGPQEAAYVAVELARAIIAETKRTESGSSNDA